MDGLQQLMRIRSEGHSFYHVAIDMCEVDRQTNITKQSISAGEMYLMIHVIILVLV